jgi:ring-1,2-phenylacetyl-CoA epoxidase subunit PaaC
LRYHVLHANTWVKQLGSATGESISRLQHSLDFSLPYAAGIFETSPFEDELIATGIFGGEKILKERWMEKIEKIIPQTALHLPSWSKVNAVLGGRTGSHSEHLQPLLDEMSEVIRIDPTAEW